MPRAVIAALFALLMLTAAAAAPLSPTVVFLPVAAAPIANDPAFDAIRTAATDLLYPSETDAPIELAIWPAGQTPAQLCASLGAAAGYELRAGASFFAGPARTYPWSDPAEQERAARFRALQQIVETHLSDLRVCRVGALRIDLYLIGVTPEGYLAGLRTFVVET